jgi:putative DNA primase/helicase
MDDTARALSALHALDPGCAREQWIRIGMAAKDAGLSLDDFTTWSGNAGNYSSERDCAQVWRSFTDGPVKAATLYALAFDAGWKDPAKPRHNGHSKRPTVSPARPPVTAQTPDKSVLALWGRCADADHSHPYIIAKRGDPDGLRVVSAGDKLTIAGLPVAGWLVVPAISLDGNLRTLQLIPPPGSGKKLNVPGASFGDGVFIVGDIAQSARVFIAEGIGQAWACWQATGCAAVVCFGAGRMAAVAKALREKYPLLSLVLVPDRGKEAQAAHIARAVLGQWAELPVDNPVNYDANDYAAENGADELAALLDTAKSPTRRYRILGANDLLNTPPLRWIVRGVVPSQGLACMYGASGSGKSFLALDMCAAVAGGAEWFDCRVTVSPVVYVALEGEHGFRQRVKAWQIHQGQDLPAGLRFVMQPFDLRNPDDLAELADAVTASGGAGGLLVIDTLNRAAGGADENSSKDMGEIIDAAKVLQSQLGGTVLLIHHSGKDQTKGLRGHSSLHAALDAAVEVRRDGDRREWVIAKSKDDGDSAAYPFRLQVVEIGTDEHGDLVTSCAVAPDERKAEFRRVLPPKSGNMRVVWDALGELLRLAGDGRPNDAPERLPLGRPAVTLDSAIEGTRERLACDPKRRTERVQQALTGLQAKGLILIDGGYVWTA